MSYLNKMYGAQTPQGIVRDKNPNRVLGGLKGAGVDTFTMLGEDGMEKRIPTEAYVKGLEEKVRQQDARLAILEKQIRRLNNDQKMDRQAFTRTFNR
jgi:cell division protein FtsB